MPKTQTFKPARPLTADEIADVDKNAKERIDGYKSAFPQDFRVDFREKSGWLPPLKAAPGFSPARSLTLRCRLDASRMSLESTTGMIAGVLGLTPEGEEPADFRVETYLTFGDREGGLLPGNTYDVNVGVICESGRMRMEFIRGGFRLGDDRGEYGRDELAERMAVQGRYNREDVEAVIEAGRLPIRVEPRRGSIRLEHSGDGELYPYREFDGLAEGLGVGLFQVELPDADDLARRYHDDLAALPAPTGIEVHGAVGIGKGDRKADPCPATYKHLLAHPWPATYFDLTADFRLKSARSLEGLRSFTRLVKPGFKLPLGQSKLDAKRAAKLLVQVKVDGHHLSLQLPTEDEPMLAVFGRRLGVAFA